MTFRKVLFWMHLVAGCVTGVVILLMSVTGVLLTYERQMLARADRGAFQTKNPPAGKSRLGVDELLKRLEEQPGGIPRNASLVMRSNPTEPVEVSLGRDGAMYADPYDGRILGRSDSGMRGVFQKITAWHRWLGSEGEGRATGKAITGGSNFAFLFIVASGMYLWLPKFWSMQHLRPITWFKGGLSGKARDFNWHNVFGFWTALPLLIVVASAVPMSYTWANNLLYQMTGSEIPRPNAPGGGDRGEQKGGGGRAQGERAEAKGGRREDRGGIAKNGGKRGGPGEGRRGSEGRVAGGGRELPQSAQGSGASPRDGDRREEGSNRPGLNSLWARAEKQVSGWQSISMRIPGRASAPVVFAIDTGDGGQPQKKSTLTLDAATGAVTKYETFDTNSAGRKLRTWSRFAHTGEYYGIIGQTIAGVASFAGVMLVWTGIALALRRLSAWRARRARQVSSSVDQSVVA